nr:helix-turn-helix transcriptional regulator [Flammeovirgaceae bacterium]
PIKNQRNDTPSESTFLTKKEREVLTALTMECDNQKVGNILGIKPTTVMTHKKHLIKKLGVKSTAELIIYSFKNLILQNHYSL